MYVEIYPGPWTSRSMTSLTCCEVNCLLVVASAYVVRSVSELTFSYPAFNK